jgi:hypothetical protein
VKCSIVFPKCKTFVLLERRQHNLVNRKIYTESDKVLMFIFLASEVSDLEYHISATLT